MSLRPPTFRRNTASAFRILGEAKGPPCIRRQPRIRATERKRQREDRSIEGSRAISAFVVALEVAASACGVAQARHLFARFSQGIAATILEVRCQPTRRNKRSHGAKSSSALAETSKPTASRPDVQCTRPALPRCRSNLRDVDDGWEGVLALGLLTQSRSCSLSRSRSRTRCAFEERVQPRSRS